MPSPWVRRANEGRLPGKSYDKNAPAGNHQSHVDRASRTHPFNDTGALRRRMEQGKKNA